MTMTFYVGTFSSSDGRLIDANRFPDKRDFFGYAANVTATAPVDISYRDSIDTICEKLEDRGFGSGSRFHTRISYKEFKKFKRR